MKSISNLVDSKIQFKAKQLDKFTRLIRASLPVNCQPHVSVADIREFQLVLLTDSPAWSARLRLYSRNMMQILEEHSNIKVNRVLIKLTPPVKPAPEPVIKRRFMNRQSSKLIQQTANSMSDPDLQQAHNNLAKKVIPEVN